MKYVMFGSTDLLFSANQRLRWLVTMVVVLLSVTAGVVAKDDAKKLSGPAREAVKQADKHVRKGEFSSAEKLLREVVRDHPENHSARIKLSTVLLKLKNLSEAYRISYDVAKSDPNNSRAFALIGMALLNSGRFPEAEQMLEVSLGADREEAMAWAGLGLLDFYENRSDRAIEHLERAVYYSPREPDYWFALAQVSARSEKYREAAEAYSQFLYVSPESDKDRRDRIKGLINFLRFLGGKRSLYSVGGDERTTVPIELIRDRPVISIKVNGRTEPLRFVLDTGSGISVISKETAARIGIKPIVKNGGRARAIGGTGSFDIVYGFVERVKIGDVQINNVPVYIRDFHSNDERIDGYIGLSLISKFLTTVDYGAHTFSLLRKESVDPLSPELNEGPFLPLRLTSSGFLSGEVTLEGVGDALNFIVDTGASISVISDKIAAHAEISRNQREQRMRVVGAAGVTEDVPSFFLPKLSFGENSAERVTAIALDLDLINEASGFTQSGILGGNFLRNYRLTFDFKNSKVIFKPVK